MLDVFSSIRRYCMVLSWNNPLVISHSHGKSPFLIAINGLNGPSTMAMLVITRWFSDVSWKVCDLRSPVGDRLEVFGYRADGWHWFLGLYVPQLIYLIWTWRMRRQNFATLCHTLSHFVGEACWNPVGTVDAVRRSTGWWSTISKRPLEWHSPSHPGWTVHMTTWRPHDHFQDFQGTGSWKGRNYGTRTVGGEYS